MGKLLKQMGFYAFFLMIVPLQAKLSGTPQSKLPNETGPLAKTATYPLTTGTSSNTSHAFPLSIHTIMAAPSLVSLPNGTVLVVGINEEKPPQIHIMGIDSQNKQLDSIQSNAIQSVINPHLILHPTSLVQQTEGRFWVTGFSQDINGSQQGFLIGYEPNGKLQLFGPEKKGVVFLSLGNIQTQVQKIAIQHESSLIIAGVKKDLLSQTPSSPINHRNSIFLQRYNTDGKLDLSFGHKGTLLIPHSAENVEITGFLVTKAGDIIISTHAESYAQGGFSEEALWAIEPYGKLRLTYGHQGKLLFEDKSKRVRNLTLLPDGVHFAVLGTKENQTIAFSEKRNLLSRGFTEAFVGAGQQASTSTERKPSVRWWNAVDFSQNGENWFVVGEKWLQSNEALADALLRKYEVGEKKWLSTEWSIAWPWPYPFVLKDVKVLPTGQIAFLAKTAETSSVPTEFKNKIVLFRFPLPKPHF